MRTTSKLVGFLLVVALAAAVPSSGVGAGRQLRFGSIVSGTGETPVSFWVKGMEGCVGAPACSAWLQSQCDPLLAEKKPALHASIVDVAKLADGVSERVLEVRGNAGLAGGRYTIQFWTGTNLATYDFCREIHPRRVTPWECSYSTRGPCRFRIPAGVRWMTISLTPDNVVLKWTLS